MAKYNVTRDGEVINVQTGHTLKPWINNRGYLQVRLNGQKYSVHRMVAEKYIPNPENKPQVNHKDGNKFNNCVENLEWSTIAENHSHASEMQLVQSGERCSWSKLNWEKVDYIRSHPELSNKKLADMFHVSESNIRAVKSGKTWAHRPKDK